VTRFDIGKFWKNKHQPLKTRKKRSEKIKQLFLGGKWKPWNAGKHLSEEHKLHLKRSNIITYKSKKLRKKVGKSVRKAFSNENIRKKIDRGVTAYYREHPNMKKEQAKKAMDYFKKNPKAFKKFLKAGKNPLKKHIKTKQGELVRSKGEQAIANWLKDNKIPYQYESKTLFLDGYFCTPDFWMPKQKAYIEFYGGYPGSWKKKVIKNKLYKRYKLNVISITPSELSNLDKAIRL
jgi:DNA helicase-4